MGNDVMKPFLDALAEIELMVRDNAARNRKIAARVKWIRSRIEDGASLTDLVRSEPRPRVVEMITTKMSALQSIGAAFRSAEARALRDEGLTMQAIADLFGVTRQRISALLKRERG